MHIFHGLLLWFLLTIGFACSKEGQVIPGLTLQFDVWTAGYESLGGVSIATFWKNKEPFRLFGGPYHSAAYAITVFRDNVYIAGTIQQPNGHYRAVYWMNGDLVILPSTGTYTLALDIAVNEKGVHVCGVDQSSSGSTPKYWLNGISADLNGGTWAGAITIYKEDVYIAGVEASTSGAAEAKYWKNGEAFNLTSGTTETLVYDIVVDSTSVYVAGYEKNLSGILVAKYWKNGTAFDLSSGITSAKATAITLSPTAVVTAGIAYAPTNQTSGIFWKNTTPFLLDALDNQTAVHGISLFNQDVYTAGSDRNKACYWINKKQVPLTDGSSPAEAHSIFVQAKK